MPRGLDPLLTPNLLRALATGERRLYGNVPETKGVIHP
jgi:L-fucose mutarotase/ribose pyranase (RbsD/FucU family)